MSIVSTGMGSTANRQIVLFCDNYGCCSLFIDDVMTNGCITYYLHSVNVELPIKMGITFFE
jgi:hypothetical protein